MRSARHTFRGPHRHLAGRTYLTALVGFLAAGVYLAGASANPVPRANPRLAHAHLTPASTSAVEEDPHQRQIQPAPSTTAQVPPTPRQRPPRSRTALATPAPRRDRPHSAQPRTALSPHRYVRRLVALQDAMALGSAEALDAHAALLKQASDVLGNNAAPLYADARNQRALLTYALIGGAPDVVAAALTAIPDDSPYRAAVEGSLAHLEGRRSDALRHFQSVNVSAIDQSLLGPVHVALAALHVADEPDEARRHMNAARAAAPGSLVEEAALRRALALAAAADDEAELAEIVSRYLRKFPASIYAGNFRLRLAAALTRMSFIDTPEGFGKLRKALAPMTREGQLEMWLQIARSALEFGRPDAARRAAEDAAAHASDGTFDANRAALYRAAAMAVDPDTFDDARRTLAALNEANLPAQEEALRQAAMTLAERVSDLPSPAKTRQQSARPAIGEEGVSGAADDGASALAESVNAALDETLLLVERFE